VRTSYRRDQQTRLDVFLSTESSYGSLNPRLFPRIFNLGCNRMAGGQAKLGPRSRGLVRGVTSLLGVESPNGGSEKIPAEHRSGRPAAILGSVRNLLTASTRDSCAFVFQDRLVQTTTAPSDATKQLARGKLQARVDNACRLKSVRPQHPTFNIFVQRALCISCERARSCLWS
jgi:hypothetical protein